MKKKRTQENLIQNLHCPRFGENWLSSDFWWVSPEALCFQFGSKISSSFLHEWDLFPLEFPPGRVNWCSRIWLEDNTRPYIHLWASILSSLSSDYNTLKVCLFHSGTTTVCYFLLKNKETNKLGAWRTKITVNKLGLIYERFYKPQNHKWQRSQKSMYSVFREVTIRITWGSC